MAIELKIPSVGESITEVEVGTWLKNTGDTVNKDEVIVEIESDKATVEVFAPVAGVVGEILKQTGEVCEVGEVIGYMEAGNGTPKTSSDSSETSTPAESTAAPVVAQATSSKTEEPVAMPAAERALAEAGLSIKELSGTGKGGRILKEDVAQAAKSTPVAPAPVSPTSSANGREEEAVRMTPIRRKIASHLLNAQQNAALLTTFNEVDMSKVMDIRKKFKDSYIDKHGVKLGFMSFFVRACIDALKTFPAVNAEIREENIIYKNYQDIGIAVSGKKGLVVPILRNAERMSFAEIESAIGDLGQRAQSNDLTVDELTGGTFTITNGGTFGSMLSTPIINPPQSAILGMHNIVQRPVVVDGEIVIRPIMYVALTYDHRIIDGSEAVRFLVRVKECIESPARIMLEI